MGLKPYILKYKIIVAATTMVFINVIVYFTGHYFQVSMNLFLSANQKIVMDILFSVLMGYLVFMFEKDVKACFISLFLFFIIMQVLMVNKSIFVLKNSSAYEIYYWIAMNLLKWFLFTAGFSLGVFVKNNSINHQKSSQGSNV